MRSLAELTQDLRLISIHGNSDRLINAVCFDSRKVTTDDLYIATRGYTVDGHEFIQSSIQKGAIAIVCEEMPKAYEEGVTYLQVDNAREALALVANAYYNHPSRHLILVGVTGTNGKTTTATLAFNLAKSTGLKSGLLSTVANYIQEEVVPSTHTTGDALQICSLMSKMVEAGCTHCFMEVTSHAMDQFRTAGLEFDVAVFTNFTQDHLDYHKTMDNYAVAKKKFFDGLAADSVAIINSDDPKAEFMSRSTLAKVITYGTTDGVDFRITDINGLPKGTHFKINQLNVKSPLHGNFNAFNLTAAMLALSAPEFDLSKCLSAARGVGSVPGRLQAVSSSSNIIGIVDFAHTPDALETVLNSVRTSQNRIICVIGCGGERDKVKRPIMAEIAARLSDEVVFTSDNPRSEDPTAILEDMRFGVQSSKNVSFEIDRREAIRQAAKKANDGDFVIVAGKGHEKYQEVAGVKLPFDDVKELRAALSSKEGFSGE